MWCRFVTCELYVVLQACFNSIRVRMGQCQLDHFELPCPADMSPLQVRTQPQPPITLHTVSVCTVTAHPAFLNACAHAVVLAAWSLADQ